MSRGGARQSQDLMAVHVHLVIKHRGVRASRTTNAPAQAHLPGLYSSISAFSIIFIPLRSTTLPLTVTVLAAYDANLSLMSLCSPIDHRRTEPFH